MDKKLKMLDLFNSQRELRANLIAVTQLSKMLSCTSRGNPVLCWNWKQVMNRWIKLHTIFYTDRLLWLFFQRIWCPKFELYEVINRRKQENSDIIYLSFEAFNSNIRCSMLKLMYKSISGYLNQLTTLFYIILHLYKSCWIPRQSL